MCSIDLIMKLINWNASAEDQYKGIQMGREVKNLKCFMQPMGINEGKQVWENCARIIAGHSDEELERYLYDLLLWLQDLNWPGALIILERLNQFGDSGCLGMLITSAREQARRLEDTPWLDNLSLLKAGHTEDIEQILDLLDERMSGTDQEKGMEMAKSISDISGLFQYEDNKHRRFTWHNCARAIAQRPDEELRHYLPQLLDWLRDMETPGAAIIYDRLQKSRLIGSIRIIYNDELLQEKEHHQWLKTIETLFRPV